MKPDNDFSLPFEGRPPDISEGGTGAGDGFWEHIADLLEQIEKNTRGMTAAVGNTGRAPTAGRAIRAVERPSRERGKSVLPLSRPDTQRAARAERAPSRHTPAPTPPSPAARPARGQNAPSTPAAGTQGNTRPSGRSSTKTPLAPEPARERTRQAENTGGAAPTKSQQEHTRRREEAVAREQSKGVLGVLKKNLAGWDGSVASPDKGDLQNAAGLAAGGPVWSAIKEVKEAVESSDDDDNSLSSILKKTLADKTGVTGAKERLEQAKKTARAKVVSWAGGTVDDDEEAHQGRGRRDKKGRFLKEQKEASASPEAKIAEETYALATSEATADKKRHDELIEAVKGSGDSAGGGLFGEGGLLDRVRGRRGESGRGVGGRRRDMGATAGRRTQRATPARGRRRGRFGLLAGGLAALGGGASLLSGDPTDLALDLGQTALTSPGAGRAVSATVGKAAGDMGKAGGALGKVAGFGAKGALGAAKAIPVAGQLLAAGMAIYDGVQGWNDTDMQQEAFGLADGQEASTGQKASTAAANILDMGGLVSGAAGLLGFDVSTADMAKGIYGIGDSIGSSLSDAWGGITGLFSGDTDAMAKGAGGVTDLAKMANPFTAAFSLLGGDDLLSGMGGSIKSFFGFGDEKHESAPAEKKEHYPPWIDNPRAWSLMDDKAKGEAIDREKAYQASVKPAAGIVGEEKKSEGLFDSLTTALSELTDKIGEEIKGDGKNKPGIIASAGGFFSRIFGGGDSQGSSGSSGGTSRPSAGATKRAQAIVGKELGALSAQYESGTKGSNAVGYDAKGGTSYGKYQIASNTGTMDSFLKWAEQNGGESGKEVAARMRAAGPLNTGGKSGAAVDAWRGLEREGKLGTLEHDFIKATHFDPAFAGIQDEGLRKRIEGSKALQDVLWSTSVQHGAGGAAKLINRNFKEGMSDEDFINALYADRGTQFGSSNAAVQQSVQNRFSNERQVALAMLQNEKRQAGTTFAQAPQDAVEATSQALQASTQDAINRGVRYQFGSKRSASGGVDCSGWVAEMNRAMMENVNAQAGKEVYSKEARAVLKKGANGGAAGIIQSVSEATGELLGNADLAPENVREGMMIGMDTGDKGWDAGRFGGIDHIVQTYRDAETGRMMVSESSGGQGVKTTDYEEWYKKQNARGAKLYGTDVTKLADAEAVKNWGGPGPQEEKTAVASAAPAGQESAPPAATPAVPVQAGESPVQVAAVQELPPQPEPRYPDPEPIQPSAPNSAGTDVTAQMVALLSQLLEVTKQQGQKQEKDTESANTPNIPMEYGDAYCVNIAHDRA